MEVTCTACGQAAQAGRAGGLYRMECLACCVRLVLSTWPSRERAAGMLAVIERCGCVERSQVLAGVEAALKARKAQASGGQAARQGTRTPGGQAPEGP